ncbi:MAG: glycosyltransferase family 2 protein [Bacteroidetes bacterium]|nr:glycosyltransferase family 2 protein [Bacteroidota bacterium]
MIRTVVILVNYYGAKDTEKCVKSLLNTSIPPKIVIVDNASREAGLEIIEKIYPEITILYSRENLGFGRGNNLGIKWALNNTQCEFVFILNNDTIVESNTIQKLEQAMDEHPEAGITAPRIVLAEDPSKLWYGGGDVDWKRGRAQIPGYMADSESSSAMTERYVAFASGCALFVRRMVIEQIGGFDKRYFMYEEDLELCLRAASNDFSIWYQPNALVRHQGQGSQKWSEEFITIQSHKNPNLPFFMFHITKNKLLTMSLHAKGWNSVKFWFVFPIFWVMKSLKFMFHGRFDASLAMFRGVKQYFLDSKVAEKKNDLCCR